MTRAAVLVLVLLVGASSLSVASGQDTAAPWAWDWGPRGGNVPVDTQIQVVWSERMDWLSVEQSFSYTDGTTVSSAGAWSHGEATNTSTFIPAAHLDSGTRYTVVFASTARDTAGNFLDQDRDGTPGEPCVPLPSFPGDCVAWQLDTAPDSTPPSVLSTSPSDGSTGVASNAAIEVHFSEPMDTGSVEAAFSFADGFSLYTVADGTASWIATAGPDDTFRFVPRLRFTTGTTVTAGLAGSVARDPDGNPLDGDGDGTGGDDHAWSFEVVSDPAPPRVLQATPADGAMGVSISTTVRIVFSKSMVRPDVEAAISLRVAGGPNLTGGDGGSTWTGSVYPADTLVFNPDPNLKTNAVYSFAIDGSVARDREGLSLDGNGNGTAEGGPADDYRGSFTTEVQDLTEPSMVSRVPERNAAGVLPTTRIVAGFSEPMNRSSVEEAFSYVDGASTYTLADGTPSWNGAGDTFMFQPSRALAFGTTYTVSIDGGIATDEAGNPLNGGATESWAFTTAGQPDTTPPQILWTSPFDGQGNVSRTARISIIFSEPMDRASVQAAIGITGGASLADFRWPNDATVEMATVEPMGYRATYLVFVLTGAADLAGNPLPQLAQIKFSTESWRGRVGGRIVDEAGAPVQGARVQLGALVVLSDSEGLFAFTSVEQGTYALAVSRDGFEPYAATVTIEPEQGDLAPITLRRESAAVDPTLWAVSGAAILSLLLLAILLRRRRAGPTERDGTWKPAKVVVMEPGVPPRDRP